MRSFFVLPVPEMQTAVLSMTPENTPRARELEVLLEKSKGGLLAPSEVGRLGVIVERALVLIQEEHGYTRLRSLNWLANDDEDWTP